MRLFAAIAAVAAVVGGTAYYQWPELRSGRPGGHRDPILELFDTDQDDQISSDEIENAVKILRARDQDGDGALTRNELPRRPRPTHRDQRGPNPSGRNNDGERPDRPEWDEAPVVDNLPVGTVVFHGGFATDDRDGGRPVALIAAALGVDTQVFRDAFANVTPSRSGPPSASHALRNKQILMDALSPHGVSNEQLDEVSNYYRYQPQRGESWPHKTAQATAIVDDGQITGFSIDNPGFGYLVAPTVAVVGFDNIRVDAKLSFSTDFEQNGRLGALEILLPTHPKVTE